MKNTLKVFLFELKSTLKEKSFKIVTLILLLIVFGVTFIPRIIGNTEKEKTFLEKTKEEQIEEIGKFGYVILDNNVLNTDLQKYMPFSLGEEYKSEEEIKKDITDEKLKSGMVIIKTDQYKLLKSGSDFMFDSIVGDLIEEGLLKYNQDKFYLEHNIDPNIVNQASEIILVSEIEEVGKSAENNYFIAYFGVFIIYFMIIMYGVSVSTSIAREKNDRTMELLITNTSSTSLIVGKVIASLVVSIGQIILMLVVGYIGFLINRSTFPEILLTILNQNISITLISIFLIFGIIGSTLYFFIYATLGSLVSRVEDAAQSTGPIQMIFIAAFMVTIFGLMDPAGEMMKISSFIPISSPMAMFARYSMTDVNLIEVLISLILLIITTWLVALLAIKIYRRATLNYGNKLSLIQIIKNLKKPE